MPNTSELDPNSRITDVTRAMEQAADKDSLDKIKDYIETHKGRIPPAEELEELYEGATNIERVRASKGLMLAAVEAAGVVNMNLSDSDHVERINPGGAPPYFDVNRPRPEDGRPQIYYRSVTQEVRTGFFKKTEVNSNQVVVIARLNNGDEKNSTVIIMITEQKDGVPQLGEDSMTSSTTMTEARMREIESLNYETLDKKGRVIKALLEGNQTMEQSMEYFRKLHKQSIYDYNRERDFRLENTNMPERWRTNQIKDEHFARIEGRYSELLQNVNNKTEQVIAETERIRQEEERIRLEAAVAAEAAARVASQQTQPGTQPIEGSQAEIEPTVERAVDNDALTSEYMRLLFDLEKNERVNRNEKLSKEEVKQLEQRLRTLREYLQMTNIQVGDVRYLRTLLVNAYGKLTMQEDFVAPSNVQELLAKDLKIKDLFK